MDKIYTKNDLEEAYKQGWKSDKNLYDGKISFKKWFKIFSKPKKCMSENKDYCNLPNRSCTQCF